jgi:hypothetical protein
MEQDPSATTPVRSRIKGGDIFVVLVALALLALLALLFLKPKQPLRDLVFGDLNGTPTPTNNAATNIATPAVIAPPQPVSTEASPATNESVAAETATVPSPAPPPAAVLSSPPTNLAPLAEYPPPGPEPVIKGRTADLLGASNNSPSVAPDKAPLRTTDVLTGSASSASNATHNP